MNGPASRPDLADVPEKAPAAAPAANAAWVDLASYDSSHYQPGRGLLVRTLWYYCSLILFENGWCPSRGLKTWLLRRFGAKIGEGLVIKPHVRIKFPWRLTVGHHCWIGQNAWIDNIADVEIGNHVCISQLVYLCTGSHDYRRTGFNLITKPIRIADGAWLGARSTVLPGVTVGANAVVAGGSIVAKDVPPATVVAGNPARPIADRQRPMG
jgi:putative colanic acid biosynthesis acetyltransferase WcaF